MEPGNEVRWRLVAEAVRTWLPLIISTCAISLTIYQAYNTRRHTRLSVQPRLDWTVNLQGDGGIAYSLTNDGFGPAILKQLNVKLDGEVVGPDGPATCAAIDRRLGREGDAWDTGCFDMEGDFVIRAGNSVVVYRSQRAAGRPVPAEAAPLGPEEYLRLMPEGSYCSFYNDCWELE
jgi:hypothetical protein